MTPASNFAVSDLFRVVFEASPDAMVVVDAKGYPVFANSAFEQLTDRSIETLSEERITSFLFISGSNIEQAQLSDRWVGKVDWRQGERCVKDLGVVIARFVDSHQKEDGYILVFRSADVERVADEELRQQQRLEALGTLAGGVAHDLNNILTGVLGHVSFLRLSLPPSGQHIESLKAIEDGAKRAASMTHQILEFARGETTGHGTVNLSLVVVAAVNLLRAAVSKSVKISVQEGSEDVYVLGDESQLSQVVMNLAVNARDALPNGGQINISLEAVNWDYVERRNPNLAVGSYCRLRIADNGSGIPDDVREQIFEPFFTTKREKGTGLGLATVFSIVQAHHGHIHVDSQEGKGSVFEVLLPSASALDAVDTAAEVRATPTGDEYILVVDDEEVVRTVMQRSLEHLGYAVDIATDGVEALKRYKKTPNKYQLVIVDMMMPNMPGDELYFELKQLNQGVRVMIASGYSSDGRARAVLEAGGLGFIQKPFAVEELAHEVRRCLDCELGPQSNNS